MSGYFESMRRTHPVKLGDVIDGKKVVKTCYQSTPEGDVPVFSLADESVTYRQCTRCGGKGFIVDRGYERICPPCGGTGCEAV
jgi:DnaJ-class molecular chaperone